MEFRCWLRAYEAHTPYQQVQEFDELRAETRFKIRVRNKPPRLMTAISFDVGNNLRSALDHAVFDASKELSGSPDPKSTKFPFPKDSASLPGDIARKKGEVPISLIPFFQRHRPYPGGDEALVGLNDLRNAKLHRTLVPFASRSGGTFVNEMVGADVTIMGEWNVSRDEYTYMVVRGRLPPRMDVGVSVFLSFSAPAVFEARPAIDVLHECVVKVDNIISEFPLEVARIKSI